MLLDLSFIDWKCDEYNMAETQGVPDIILDQSPRFKNFGSSRNYLNPTFIDPIFDPTLTTACVTWSTATRTSARLKELGHMKILPKFFKSRDRV